MKPFSKFWLCNMCSIATLSLSLGCAEMQGGSSPSATDSQAVTSTEKSDAITSGPKRISQGTQGDTLSACLARIPSDASDSQRMLATLTCERDAKTRASIDAVPGQ